MIWRHLRVISLVVGLLVCAAGAASAQDDEVDDPAETARFHFGPLRFTPSVALTSLGIDSNVFNEIDAKRDTTAAVGPAVNLWLKLGPSRFSGKTSGQYLYYKEYDSQRSWNSAGDGRWEVPFARLMPFVTGGYANTRERPGFEIDSRARRRDDSVSLGTDVRFTEKTALTLEAKRAHYSFDQNETFLGSTLATALNRTSSIADVKLRYDLSPLTTFAIEAEGAADRFAFNKIRDADSVKVMSGFELKPFALISGSAYVGYRQFNALDPNVPDYRGLVASVDAIYTVAGTRLAVKLNRDLIYSYEPTEPYYGLTAVDVTITERITHAWDIVGRGGWHSLDYRQLASVADVSGRVDTGRVYGVGIGYRVGEILRIGVDANYYQRISEALTQHDYEGFRVGASFTYGLPQ
jgi:Putative beta-barrel porin 2